MRLSFTFILLFWSWIVNGQQQSIDTIKLINVTVSATRAGDKDPVTYENISKQQIEEVYIGQDPAALLEQLSPSIITFSDAGTNIGNYVQLRLRGIDQTRVNTTLNGVPLNDMVDQGVFFSNFSDFANSINSVQVQRGMGTSSNGVASFAGSINFNSPSLTAGNSSGNIQLMTGSFGTLKTSAEFNSGRNDGNLSFYSRGTRTQTSGYKDHSGSDSYSYFFSGGYFGKNDILKITAFAGKTENDQSYLPVLLDEITTDPKTNANHHNDTDDFAQELIQLQYSRIISNQLSLNAVLYHGHADGVFPFSLDDRTQLMFGLENRRWGLLSDLSYENERVILKGGIHAYTFKRDNFNYTAPDISHLDYSDQTKKQELSTWAKINYSIGRLHLYSDVQLRHVNMNFIAPEILSYGGQVPSGGIDHSRNWLFLNPKVGLGYDLDSGSFLYASIGKTSREPTRTDILQGDGSAITEFSFQSVLNEDLVRAESVVDIEIGYKYSGKTSQLKANIFYMDFTDEISAVGALADRSYFAVRQNVASSRRMGLEVQGATKVGSSLDLSCNAIFMSTLVSFFDNGVRSYQDVNHIFAPKLMIRPSARLKLGSKVVVRLSARSVSKSFIELSNDPSFILPSYTVLDGGVHFKMSESWTLDISGFNLFDALYFNDGAVVDRDFDGSTEGPGYRIQPPRHFYVMLKYKW